MHFEIDGKINGSSSSFKKGYGTKLSLSVGEHKGIFSPKGNVKLELDEQATEDLVGHLGLKESPRMYEELIGKLIRIIVR